MKKTEMLGKLYTLLYKETDLNEDSLEELCIKILDEVENSGMNPPYCGEHITEEFGFYRMNMYSTRWEEE